MNPKPTSTRRQRQRARSARRFAKHFGSRAYVAAVCAEGCVVYRHDCTGPVEFSHLVSRGAGGTYRDGVGMCRQAHHEWHTWGRATFCARYEMEWPFLVSLAAKYATKFGHLVPQED